MTAYRPAHVEQTADVWGRDRQARIREPDQLYPSVEHYITFSDFVKIRALFGIFTQHRFLLSGVSVRLTPTLRPQGLSFTSASVNPISI